jgi:mannosyltransferase
LSSARQWNVRKSLAEHICSETLEEKRKTIRYKADLFLSGGFATVLVTAILGLAVSVLWLVPLRSSLWLDETGTVWAARGTLRDVWERAFHPGQPSVAFAIMTWWAVHLGGLDEITLRMPSLVASSVAAVGVYLLARRFCDPHQSLLACALFATHSTVVFAAADARPYALALMAVVWSILMLVRWGETGQFTYGFACQLLIALSIYFHYLCATLIPLQLWYMIRRGSVSRSMWRQVVSLGVALGALLVVLLPHARQLWRLRADHSFTGMPSIGDVIGAFLYVRLVAGTVAGLAVARCIWPAFSVRPQAWFTRSHLFLLGWYLGPIVILLATSSAKPASLCRGTICGVSQGWRSWWRLH